MKQGKGTLEVLSNSDVLCLQIIFEGVRGTGSQGDIAIDDVTLKKGDCPRKPVVPDKGEWLCLG